MASSAYVCIERKQNRGCSSMAEHQLPKLTVRVRFPSPALTYKNLPVFRGGFVCQELEDAGNREEHFRQEV